MGAFFIFVIACMVIFGLEDFEKAHPGVLGTIIITAIIIIALIIILYFIIKKSKKNDLIKKYSAEIDKYARIYVDLVRATNNLGGYVFISNSRYFDWEKDSTAFSPHSYMLYFEVKLESYFPREVRDYYENRYAYGIPYDEELHKKICLEDNFKDCKNIDKDVLWDCILDEIIDNKCEKWCWNEWYFHYPIVCPDEFKGDKRELFIDAIKKRASQPKNAVENKPVIPDPVVRCEDKHKPLSDASESVSVPENAIPNISIKKKIKYDDGTFCTAAVSRGVRKFFYTIGMYKQAVITDNINKKSCNLEEKAWFSSDNHYRYDITYSKTQKLWLIKFKPYKSCYIMVNKGRNITSMYLPSGGKKTHIRIINTDTQNVEQDFDIMVT